MMNVCQDRYAVFTIWRELLHMAGAMAANAESQTHREAAIADLDRMPQGWIQNLSPNRAGLAAAITATMHALGGAVSKSERHALADALRLQVVAARAEPPSPPPRRVWGEPRKWWTEIDQ